MVIKKSSFLFLIFSIFILVGLFFILAAIIPAAPTNVHFQLNSSTIYDNDEKISLNWTAGDVDTANYTIWISNDGGLNYFKSIKNDSATGVIYSNSTDANYTFIVQRVNATNPSINALNSSNISIVFDSTAASLIKIHSFSYEANSSNRAFTNSSTLNLNVSVSDATSNAHTCFFNLNGTNETILAVNNWCNSTSLNLTGLSDGTHMIKIYVNDSAGNLALNNTKIYFETDSTNPSASASCSDETEGNSFPNSCSGTDTTSGINSSATSSSSSSGDGTSTPSLTGTFTYTCSVTDYAGNTNSSSCSYTIVGSGSNAGSGSSSSSSISNESEASNVQFETMSIDSEITLSSGKNVSLSSITSEKVGVEIENKSFEVEVGSSEKIDIDDDGYYDLQIKVNSVNEDNEAELEFKTIYEKIPSKEEKGVEEKKKTEKSNVVYWVIGGIILIVIILFIFRKKFFSKKTKIVE